MEQINLTSTCDITTGKLDANAAEDNGQYMYFTCAPEPLRINEFAFDEEAILLAGNNASGNFHCQRYNGKFNAYQRTYVITVKEGYDIDYIYYSLLINLQRLKKIAQGSQTKFLTMEILNGFHLPNIQLSEQKHISRILSVIDAKISNNSTICSELESMAKLIYEYWFVQFDFPNKNGRPYKTSGGKMVWNEELKREIPEGWEVTKLREHIGLERGISYSTADLQGNGIPLINLGSFAIGGGYKEDNLKTYSGEYSNNKIIAPYDLIICLTQQTSIDPNKDVIGCAMLVPDIFDGDVVISQDLTKIVCSEELKFYLVQYFNTSYFHRYISGFASGSNILHLDINGILNNVIIIPPNNILDKFEKTMKAVFKKRSECVIESQQLASLRDFLLPMLMNGQVKVGNIA